ncbi:MAG TPA: site-2 protease family protein [Blastocatellia bacterium]|nr:site-2 protease family protein [Blastocatellia bacterium]
MLRGGLHIARLLGIDIYVDWSWLFIFLLITSNLAAGVFPQWHPEWSFWLSWLVAAVAAVLFFVSVLLHELSHSIVARARGMRVRRITLFLFGGVSNIEREPPAPLTEFLMALVGPLTSIVLGVVFLIIGSLTAGSAAAMSDPVASFARLDPLSTLLLWLGPINIVLGLFNLIPGFPLDGGRVLRSIVWAVTGNLHRATRVASAAGQFVGWTFIVVGIAMAFGAKVPVFGSGLIGGLWLAFIGWFLSSAAQSNYQQLLIHDLLEDVPVARLMKSNVPTISPHASVSSLIYDFIMKSDERGFTVVQDGRIVGLVTLEDVRKLPREAWEHTNIGQIMTPADQLVLATPEEDVSEAMDQLISRDVRQLPVVRNGELVGMLRRRDVVKWLQIQSGFAAGPMA